MLIVDGKRRAIEYLTHTQKIYKKIGYKNDEERPILVVPKSGLLPVMLSNAQKVQRLTDEPMDVIKIIGNKMFIPVGIKVQTWDSLSEQEQMGIANRYSQNFIAQLGNMKVMECGLYKTTNDYLIEEYGLYVVGGPIT